MMNSRHLARALVFLAAIIVTPCLSAEPVDLARADSNGYQPMGAQDWPLERFLTRPQVREVKLSPSGERVAYMLREPASLWRLDLDDGEKTKLLNSRLIESFYWSKDGGGLFIEAEDRLGYVDVETGGARWIYVHEEPREPRFLRVDTTRPRHVLVSEKVRDDLYQLVRVDSRGDRELVLEWPQVIAGVLLGTDGHVRYVKRAEGLEQVVLRVDRGAAKGALRDGTGDFAIQEVMRCEALDLCLPVAYEELDGTRERLWMVGHGVVASGAVGEHVVGKGRHDLRHLFSVDIDASQAKGPVSRLSASTQESGHLDPLALADLDDVWGDRRGKPQWVSYDSDRRRIYAVDEALVEPIEALKRRLPEARLDLQLPDNPVRPPLWLVEETGPRLQYPRFHLFDPKSQELREILQKERSQAPSLPASEFAEASFLSFEASDGLRVHGLFYAPPGLDAEAARAAPVVVRVHGGPWNHVRARWSSLTQFLVSRGYLVYEPNFRSSTGFGRRHVVSAEGDFGDGRVQLDILEGLEDIHERGFGDPRRVAMIGHSFGGFSTLGALAFTPSRFAAGVASAPPIDLVRAIRDLPEDELQANGIPRRIVLRQLVGDLEDPAVALALRRQSPEARLSATERPLLILAGGADAKVDITDVRHYAGALRGLGKDVSFLVDEAQGHSFEHEVSLGTYFFLVERFLAHHLGGRVVATEDRRLEDYLERHLLFAGPSLEEALASPSTAELRDRDPAG